MGKIQVEIVDCELEHGNIDISNSSNPSKDATTWWFIRSANQQIGKSKDDQYP
jgi:hypothetical protein